MFTPFTSLFWFLVNIFKKFYYLYIKQGILDLLILLYIFFGRNWFKKIKTIESFILYYKNKLMTIFYNIINIIIIWFIYSFPFNQKNREKERLAVIDEEIAYFTHLRDFFKLKWDGSFFNIKSFIKYCWFKFVLLLFLRKRRCYVRKYAWFLNKKKQLVRAIYYIFFFFYDYIKKYKINYWIHSHIMTAISIIVDIIKYILFKNNNSFMRLYKKRLVFLNYCETYPIDVFRGYIHFVSEVIIIFAWHVDYFFFIYIHWRLKTYFINFLKFLTVLDKLFSVVAIFFFKLLYIWDNTFSIIVYTHMYNKLVKKYFFKLLHILYNKFNIIGYTYMCNKLVVKKYFFKLLHILVDTFNIIIYTYMCNKLVVKKYFFKLLYILVNTFNIIEYIYMCNKLVVKKYFFKLLYILYNTFNIIGYIYMYNKLVVKKYFFKHVLPEIKTNLNFYYNEMLLYFKNLPQRLKIFLFKFISLLFYTLVQSLKNLPRNLKILSCKIIMLVKIFYNLMIPIIKLLIKFIKFALRMYIKFSKTKMNMYRDSIKILYKKLNKNKLFIIYYNFTKKISYILIILFAILLFLITVFFINYVNRHKNNSNNNFFIGITNCYLFLVWFFQSFNFGQDIYLQFDNYSAVFIHSYSNKFPIFFDYKIVIKDEYCELLILSIFFSSAIIMLVVFIIGLLSLIPKIITNFLLQKRNILVSFMFRSNYLTEYTNSNIRDWFFFFYFILIFFIIELPFLYLLPIIFSGFTYIKLIVYFIILFNTFLITITNLIFFGSGFIVYLRGSSYSKYSFIEFIKDLIYFFAYFCRYLIQCLRIIIIFIKLIIFNELSIIFLELLQEFGIYSYTNIYEININFFF